MHVADGIFPVGACLAAHAASYGGLYLAGRNLKPEDASRMGLLAAAAFVVSTVLQFPLAGVSMHLGLYGLLGILLGRRAFPVVFAGLLFQALLFQHGGLLSLGVNALNMGCGALAGWAVWRIPLVGRIVYFFDARGALAGWAIWPIGAFAEALRAAAAGFLGALLPAFLLAAEFELAGYGRGFYFIASAYAAAALVEAAAAAAIIIFLRKTKPEILCPAAAQPVPCD